MSPGALTNGLPFDLDLNLNTPQIRCVLKMGSITYISSLDLRIRVESSMIYCHASLKPQLKLKKSKFCSIKLKI